MKTIEKEIYRLCDEIDYWKGRAEYWEKEFEKEREERVKLINESIESTKKGVADALMLAFSVKDSPDGSLSISKEDRKHLASRFKSNLTENKSRNTNKQVK